MGRRKGAAEQQTDDTEYSSHSQYTATAECESNTDRAGLVIDSEDSIRRKGENMHQNSLQRQQLSPYRTESNTAGGDTLSNQPNNPEYITDKRTSPSCTTEMEVERHKTYIASGTTGQNRLERCDVRPLLYNRGVDGSNQHSIYRNGNQHEQINSTREPNWNHRRESATNAAWSSPLQSHSYTGHFPQANFRPYMSDRDQQRQDSLPPQHRRNFEQHLDREYQQHRSQRQSSNNDIKIPPFTGKEDWSVWINRFEVIAERKQWTKDEMMDHILPKLQGHAGDFVYTRLPRWKLFDYNELREELTNQFRVIETQQSYAAKFSKRDQRHGETTEEYAAELKRLYAKAYKSRGNQVRQEDLVRRFLDGLKDSEAIFEVEFNKDPRTIDEAIYHVVRFIHVRQTREKDPYNERKMKRFTRPVYEDCLSEEESDSDGNTNETTEARICRSRPIPERRPRDAKRDIKQEDKAPSSLHAALLEVISKLNQIVSQYSMRERREYTCFACGEEGHFIRDCPQKSEQQKQDQEKQDKDKSTSQYRQKQNHLNL